VHLLRQIL